VILAGGGAAETARSLEEAVPSCVAIGA
jgi:hypothetical protein